MNDYERKQQARKERLEAKAQGARAKASQHFNSANRIADGIPMGQPILVGHHSERRHRKDLARMDRGMRKGIEESDRAADLQHAADAVGTGGISSDDPEAIAKLKAELAVLEANRAEEKRLNAEMRKKAKSTEKVLGRKPSQAEYLAIIDSLKTHETFREALKRSARAFAWLPQFGNGNAANIRRIEQRIAELEKRDATPERQRVVGLVKLAEPLVIEGEIYDELGFELRENKELNRCQIIFAVQPSKSLREKLKARGFRWAPSEGAWQRHMSNGAWYDATQILGPGHAAD